MNVENKAPDSWLFGHPLDVFGVVDLALLQAQLIAGFPSKRSFPAMHHNEKTYHTNSVA